jgi:hypothetical protein
MFLSIFQNIERKYVYRCFQNVVFYSEGENICTLKVSARDNNEVGNLTL